MIQHIKIFLQELIFQVELAKMQFCFKIVLLQKQSAYLQVMCQYYGAFYNPILRN